MRGRKPVTGSYTGAGAAITFDLGFRPAMVLIINHTDGDLWCVKIDGMPGSEENRVTGSGASGNSADGITITDRGFIAGTDNTESAKLFYYIAF